MIIKLLILLNIAMIGCLNKSSSTNNKNTKKNSDPTVAGKSEIAVEPDMDNQQLDVQNDTLRYLESNTTSINADENSSTVITENQNRNAESDIVNDTKQDQSNITSNNPSIVNIDIQQPSGGDVDYTNEFNLSLQMENTYNNREYNYTDENSNIIEDAENVSNKNTQKDNEDEKEYLRWQEKVSDFNVAEMLTISLKGSRYAFYEEIQNVPSLIRSAFFISDRGEKINFFLYDNKKTILLGDFNKRYGYYEYEVKTPGTYKFIIDGTGSGNSKKVTFAIHTGNNTDVHLETQNIDKMSERFQKVKKRMKEIKTRQNFFVKNIERYFENTNRHNKHIVTMSIIECIMMFIIMIVQFTYLKSLLKNF